MTDSIIRADNLRVIKLHDTGQHPVFGRLHVNTVYVPIEHHTVPSAFFYPDEIENISPVPKRGTYIDSTVAGSGSPVAKWPLVSWKVPALPRIYPVIFRAVVNSTWRGTILGFYVGSRLFHITDMDNFFALISSTQVGGPLQVAYTAPYMPTPAELDTYQRFTVVQMDTLPGGFSSPAPIGNSSNDPARSAISLEIG